MESIRARTDVAVKDKETADALKPWYNQFCKRLCFHDEYLGTFNRLNVKLVNTKGQDVRRITDWREAGDLAELDIKYNQLDDEPPVVNGSLDVEVSTQPDVEMRVRKNDEKTLVELYFDLQAKHQAEMNDLLSKHRGKIEKLLKKQKLGHAKKDFGVEGI
jgi:hypothetical protein